MDCSKLICEVRKKPLLWDTRNANYKNKKKIRDAWDAVGKVLNCDADSAKKKWRSLRNNYTQEKNKINKKLKSGSAGSQIYTSRWILFADMDFLRAVTTPAKPTGNLNDSLYEDESIVEPGDSHAENETPEENDSNLSLNFETSKTRKHQVNIEKSPPKKVTYKRKCCNQDSEFIELGREMLNMLKRKKENTNDGDFHFLMSFLPHMQQMSQIKNTRFRLKMSQLLMETLEGNDSSSRGEQVNDHLIPTTTHWRTSTENFANNVLPY